MTSSNEVMDVDADASVATTASTLEEAAEARRKRLLEMKAKYESTGLSNFLSNTVLNADSIFTVLIISVMSDGKT